MLKNKKIEISKLKNNLKESLRELEKKFELEDVKKTNSLHSEFDFEIVLPISIFGVNFRTELIKFLKNKIQNRSFNIFYIESINYEDIKNKELPRLFSCHNHDYYKCILPLKIEFLYFEKFSIIKGILILNTEQKEDKFEVYVENNYISCKLQLNNNQIVETDHNSNEAILHDRNQRKKYKNHDEINIKIINFKSNQLEDTYAAKINCEGEIAL